ncbi:hypothetical protein MMC07_003767 [Pseudocyphellaria aurata]|nr:hypothetical protein [Pseudocyphellaria aurata]
MSSSSSRPRAAYIEDYNEEAHTTVPETRQSANIAAKRSKPDIAKLKAAQGGREDASDSGYSNRTMSIGGGGEPSLKPTAERKPEYQRMSKAESRAGNPPLKLDTSVAMSKRKSEYAGRTSAITPKSTQKPTVRRIDSTTRDGKGARQEDCSCLDCMTKPRPSATPQETSRRINYYDTVQRPKPEAPVPPPPSKPPPLKPIKEAPVVQPAQSRPRATTMQSHRTARPVSFHGDPVYVQPVYMEPRPTSTFPTTLPFQPPSYPPPKPTYIAPNVQPMPRLEPPPQRAFTYDPQPQPPARPQPRQWTSELLPPSHQPLIFNSSPIVEYPPQLHYPPPVSLSQSLPPRLMAQYPANVPEEMYPFDEDYYLMPPPAPPPRLNTSSKSSRPGIRHAVTSVAHPTLHHDRRSIRIADIVPEYVPQRSPRKASPERPEKARRPPLPGRPGHDSTAEKALPKHPSPPPRVRVESGNSAATASAKQRRRASYYGHETPRDLERVVEAYQASKAGHLAPSPPLEEFSSDALKLVRKKPHHGGSSDGGSRASGEGRAGSREGSEVKPRSSTDRRSDVKARASAMPAGNENDGFMMRFNSGVSVDFDGVEGRTISLRPSAETAGGMELSIGGRGRGGSGANGGRDKSRRPGSYVEGVRELEYARSVGREGDGGRDRERERERERGREREREKEREKERARDKERDTERERDREIARDREKRFGASRSRRSSRSGYSGRGGLE